MWTDLIVRYIGTIFQNRSSMSTVDVVSLCITLQALVRYLTSLRASFAHLVLSLCRFRLP